MLRPAWYRLIAGPTAIPAAPAPAACSGGEVMTALAVRARSLRRRAPSLLGYSE